MNKNLSLVFFGSGPVASESLRLLAQTFDIEAVITKPTTANEMGAICPNTPLYIVSDKDTLDALLEEQHFLSRVGVLIDFGIIVSQKVIEYFPKGIINSHFSLLPELRGADPISFAILEDKEKTGVSLMLLVEKMDEGPIIGYGELDLDGTESSTTLTSNLIELSDSLLKTLLIDYVDDKIATSSQNGKPTYTRKLTKNDGILDWKKSASILEREVRAYIEWPKSRTIFNEIDCVITEVSIINDSGKPGAIFVKDKKLAVYCGVQALLIEKIKPAGKKEMDSQSFLAGYKSRINL
jgi:methionyl-tRNA formyltransferase